MKYTVTVTHPGMAAEHTFDVEAHNESEARDKAVRRAVQREAREHYYVPPATAEGFAEIAEGATIVRRHGET